jgi:hypothetical protein
MPDLRYRFIVDADAQLLDRGDHQSGFIGEVEQFFGRTVKKADRPFPDLIVLVLARTVILVLADDLGG